LKECRVSITARHTTSSFIPPVYEYGATAQPTYVDDAYTVVLLHGDGSDGQRRFADQSGKQWTANGDAQIDTAQYKFSPSSMLFDGTGDYLETPDSDDFSFVGTDVTIDFWMRPNSVTGSQGFFGQETAGTTYPSNFCERATTNIRWVVRKASGGNGDIIDITSSGVTLAIGQWYHIACVKNGTTYTIYIDGVSRASTTSATATENTSSTFRVGDRSSATTEPFNGWIDEFRFSKGIARWTTTFTPSTTPYAGTHVYAEIPITSDTSIDSNAPTTNFDTDTRFMVGEQVGATAIFRGLIQPDYSSIPSGKTFTFNSFKLTPTGDVSSNNRLIYFYRLLRAWVSNQATWNVYSTGNNWGTAGAGNSSTDYDGATVYGKSVQLGTPTLNSPVEIVLTASEAQKLYDGTHTNNGLLALVATETDDLVEYGSNAQATIAYRPYMRVVYASTSTGMLGAIWF
jgi:hypothetical protein